MAKGSSRHRRAIEPVVERAQHAGRRAPDEPVLLGHGVETAVLAGRPSRASAARGWPGPSGSRTASRRCRPPRPDWASAAKPGATKPTTGVIMIAGAGAVGRREARQADADRGPGRSPPAPRAAPSAQGVSPGSQRPPGRATWPVWLRRVSARRVRITVRPSSRSTRPISTAAGVQRAARIGGARCG